MKLCYDCAHIMNNADDFCPYCGADTRKNNVPKAEYHLPPGFALKNSRYIIGRALGSGGFGITYAGFDTVLQKRVAIKEYLPGELATRMPGTAVISVFQTEETETQYIKGLQSFTDEAERLAMFNGIDGVVNIYDCFTQNDTAYIVMELLDGMTLKKYLDIKGKLSFNETVSIMVPVLEALEVVHKRGIIHRDVSPDNIFLTDDGKVKLLDFGAARYASALSEKSLSIILKPGYAPEEQYMSKGEQGPWSDVYAAGATMYKMVTGVIPPESLERAARDTMKPPTKLGARLSKNAETAILNALNVNAPSRTQTAEEFLEQLFSTTEVKRAADRKNRKAWALPKWVYWALAGVFAAGGIFAALILTKVINFGPAIEKHTSGYVNAPNLIGMTENDAKTAYTDWSIVTVDSDATDEVEIGCIMAQSPGFGELVMPRTPIEVTVNRGIENVKGVMPYLRGEKLADAMSLLEGYSVELIYEYDDTVIAGNIKSTEPGFGAQLEDGQTVTLTVSKGGLLEGVEIEGSRDGGITLAPGSEPYQLVLRLIPANADESLIEITWSSDDPTVASVSETGVVTALSQGAARITAHAVKLSEEDGSAVFETSGEILVTVAYPGAAATEIPPDSPEAPVSFASAEFENAFRSVTGLTGQLHNRDIWQITELELKDRGLTDISDLAKFKSLKKLNLYNNDITDISPLSGLTELQTLVLERNSISDLTPLSGLTSLRGLDLERNRIRDLTPLSRLTGLVALALTENEISDITPLSGLTSMKRLYLSMNSISDISPLRGMKQLEELLARNNNIEDISALLELDGLKGVELDFNPVDRLQLAALKNRLPDCRITP